MRKAVIDVGSNSILLTVEEYDGSSWKSLVDKTSVTSLGEGTKSSGLLGETGMAASLDALKLFFDEAKSLESNSIVAAATMAVRIAKNRDDFLDRAAAQGTPVSILSGEDEAQLGFDSVATDPIFAPYPILSIIDPGGQSTELMTAVRTAEGWEMKHRQSYPVGTLGLRSTYLQSESPEPPEILNAIEFLDNLIGFRYSPNEGGCPVVLGATGTNLVSMREKLEIWDPTRVHGAWLTYEEISRSVGSLMQLTDIERSHIQGIEPGREKTIHIGALIVERFLFAIRSSGCAVSVRGWRHALLEKGLPVL